jgi:hypothetical protein
MSFHGQSGGHDFYFDTGVCTKCGMTSEYYRDNGKPRCSGRRTEPKFTVLALIAGASIVLSLFSTHVLADAQIDRACTPNGALVGGSSCTIKFSGEIAPGDAKRVEQAIVGSPYIVQIANFNSPGGDPFEALKIADVLNRYFVSVATGRCDGGCSAGTDVCASACSLIYLAANERFGNAVFLHRPSFPLAFFGSLTGEQAKRAYDTAWRRLRKEMEERSIPRDDIDLIMDIPSASVERIRSGYPQDSPWMEEWLTAKCGAAQRPYIDPKAIICQSDAVMAEERRVQGHF